MEFLSGGRNRILAISVENFSYKSVLFSKNTDAAQGGIDFFDSGNIINEFEVSERDLEKQAERAFRKIFDKAAEARGKIDLCLIIFSAPWHISETYKVEITKQTAFAFTRQDFDNVLKNEDSAFVKNVKTGFNSDLKFIEGDIMKTLMNGYETHFPFDKKAETVKINIYISAVQKNLFDRINDLAKEQLGFSFENHKLKIKTRQMILFSVLRKKFDFENGFIFIDIGSEITEITLIKNGYIEETTGFKKGRNFFIRRLMNGFNIEFHEAEDMFKRHNADLTESETNKKVGSILSGAKNDWLSGFSEIIKAMSKDYFLPKILAVFSPDMFLGKVFSGKDDLKINLFSEIKEVSCKDFFASGEYFDEKILNSFLFFEIAYLRDFNHF